MLEMKNITKIYNPGTVQETCLFRDFSLTINKGSFVSVVGSNGSGKTSMLNLLCGSIPVDAGQILMDGQDITRVKEFRRYRRMGRVYQNGNVRDNDDSTKPVNGGQQRQTIRTDPRHEPQEARSVSSDAGAAGSGLGG